MDQNYDHLYKIILLGNASVGKTCILQQYLKGNLPKNPQPTIGVEFATKNVVLKNGATIKAQIWDTAGQERYTAICSAHYRRAVGALLVYDITKEETFTRLQTWLENLRAHADQDIIIMLVGNKLDLVEQNPDLRQVPYEVGQELARQENLLFVEASAITKSNVKEAFEILLQEISNQKQKLPLKQTPATMRLDKSMQNTGKGSGCC